ncbi:ubiquinol-cytochrome c reductase cytochrome c subunit [Caballeronia udeis]|uniref:Ubiquinol-cytochrome c reductase cytochrome c subunit n=2 Tax=Caballeronia udeis TaxID=1232866 RepID=A0ABW8MRY6_9BURK
MRTYAIRRILLCMLSSISAVASLAALGASGDANIGHALYVRDGCYECHGYVGQGSPMSGPSLAPSPIPLSAMIAYVHAPKGQMPPYSAKILSDQELADIHSYLSSIPPAPSADSISLLTDSGAQTPVPMLPGRGEQVFAARCAACHGAQGLGGAGPSLVGVNEKLGGVGRIAAFIKAPSGAMPRLFPGVISEQDVALVSNYVATLK